MKKILAILAVLFIIPAAGCRNSQDSEAGASSSAAGSAPSGSPSASAYSTGFYRPHPRQDAWSFA